MNTCQAVKKRIKELLKEKNMSLYRLSKNSGILHGSMMCIMNGRNKNITLKTIYQIAYGFNMTIYEFLDDDIFKMENIDFL